jgi:hypothetical protein
MTDVQLYAQITSLPAELKKEVSDFVEFLKQKTKSKTILKKRQLGAARGLIKMSSDFDEPLEDFKDYM